MARWILPLLSVIALAGCAVVDLTAHGVKRYEKSKEQERAAGQPGGQPATMETSRNDEPMRDAGYGQPVEPASVGGAIQSQPLD
ncbi:MAG: hypothetical protein FD176_2720 [Rhodospirillaceae bacterium]|nr:MAG: hypothetical protein FD176_2720 [Rhodospirillaceae bacterium]TNC98231.1 MAG: Secreted protein [Stygiobacter sp.]